MNTSSSNSISSDSTSEAVFVLPLIPLVDFSNATSADEEDFSSDSASGADSDFSGSLVEAMD